VKVIIRSHAFSDLEKIHNWIAKDSPENARRVADRILSAIEDNLVDFPFIGRRGRTRGTRELVVSGLPYVIVYTVEAARQAVVVRAIYHGAQRR
jgi:addiction module RelE/StbE family toxin